MKRFRTILIALPLMCGICAIGCGSSNDTGTFNPFVQSITSVTLSPKPVTKTTGQTQQFAFTASFNDGSNVNFTNGANWSSSNPAVVSVDSNGLATANAPGSAVITASGAGFTDTAAFTVTGTGTPVNLVALNSSGTGLVRFTSTNPGTPTNVAVTGVTAGDVLVGIDVRPQNRFLYGLGFNSGAGTVQVYAINPDNGFATAVGVPASFVTAGGAARPITGNGFGFDFNPAADRIRVVTSTGQNFRLNPNTGAAVDGDGGNGGNQMDGDISGATTVADAAAYTNNQANNGGITTLYTLDSVLNSLFIQNPPNNGTQANTLAITLGGNPLDFSAINGFDIAPGVNAAASNAPVATGSGLAALTVAGTTNLYNVNLVNGQATLLGILNANLSGLTILPDAGGEPAIGQDGANLLRFSVNTPGTLTTQATAGIVAGETLVGLDYRPATGQLLALGVNATANTGTIYLVDPQNGQLTAIGANGQVAFVAADGVTAVDLPDPATTGYGFDFNPTVDRIRVTTGTGLNFRLNPNTGAPIDGDAGSAGTQTDGAINGSGVTGIGGVAYTNSFGQNLTGGVTTLYTLDDAGNQLLIQNPPNNGTQTTPLAVTLGGVALNFTAINGFDIGRSVAVTTNSAPATGSGTAALTVGGVTGIYTINLATGAATNLGAIGAGATPLLGLTIGN